MMSYGFASYDSTGSPLLTMDDTSLLILHTQYIPANTSGFKLIPTLDPLYARAFVLPIGFNKVAKLPIITLSLGRVDWSSPRSSYAVNSQLVVVTY